MKYTLEIHQTLEYQTYIKALGWSVYKDIWGVGYYRTIPFIGRLMKLQRITSLPEVNDMQEIIKELDIKKLSIEPDGKITQEELHIWTNKIKKYVKLTRSPFIPTKTIRVDLTASEHTLFSSLTEAKRRAVRRATNLGVIVKQSDEIAQGIQTKARAAGFFGLITTTGMQELWNAVGKTKRTLLLAFHPTFGNLPIGCVFLVHQEGISYYWIAGATKKAKHLFAPTLLAWEAIKISQTFRSHTFDFLGVWDERIPKEHTDWLGFTKFKEGFGGYPYYYSTYALE